MPRTLYPLSTPGIDKPDNQKCPQAPEAPLEQPDTSELIRSSIVDGNFWKPPMDLHVPEVGQAQYPQRLRAPAQELPMVISSHRGTTVLPAAIEDSPTTSMSAPTTAAVLANDPLA